MLFIKAQPGLVADIEEGAHIAVGPVQDLGEMSLGNLELDFKKLSQRLTRDL